MATERASPFKQHAKNAVRYLFAGGAGVAFAYLAWSPVGVDRQDEATIDQAVVPAAMIEAIREKGLLQPNATEDKSPTPVSGLFDDRDTAIIQPAYHSVASHNGILIFSVATFEGDAAATPAAKHYATVNAKSRAPPL